MYAKYDVDICVRENCLLIFTKDYIKYSSGYRMKDSVSKWLRGASGYQKQNCE